MDEKKAFEVAQALWGKWMLRRKKLEKAAAEKVAAERAPGTTLDDQLFRSYLDVLPSNHTISGSYPDAGRVFDTVDVFWMHFGLHS